MWLARTILEQNTDPAFIDSLFAHTSIKKNTELVELLSQWKDLWFSPWLLTYMFDGHEDSIKEAIKENCHPVMIKYLQKYTLQQGIEHWNIANHPFMTPDMVYEFFAPYKALHLEQENIDQLVIRVFTQDAMLLWSSFVPVNRENMYFTFSKIKKSEPDEQGMIKLQFIEKKIMSAHREWLQSVAWYIQEKFPNRNLFEVLNLDPEKIL